MVRKGGMGQWGGGGGGGEGGRERWREVGGLCHHDRGHCVRDHRLYILPTQL